jgi:hypothetical protein
MIHDKQLDAIGVGSQDFLGIENVADWLLQYGEELRCYAISDQLIHE